MTVHSKQIHEVLHNHFPYLKLHASRFILIFMKILKMYLKVKYCEVNKDITYTLQTELTIHIKYQKRGQNIPKNLLLL
jgi:hypothetical protein